MGTRGSVCLVNGGKTVALYNHFDSYPEGLGVEILNLLRGKNLAARIREVLPGVVTVSNDEILAIAYELAGGKDVYEKMNMRESNSLYNKACESLQPMHDLTDIAGFLEDLCDGNVQSGYKIKVSPYFPADSLFCEWGYVIDTDKGVFEIYKGFNMTPVGKEERFSYLEEFCENGYHPIRMVCAFSLEDLPGADMMLDAIKRAIGDSDGDSDAATCETPDKYPCMLECNFGDGSHKEYEINSDAMMNAFLLQSCCEAFRMSTSMKAVSNGVVLANVSFLPIDS